MEIKRHYQPKDINTILLPDLIEKYQSMIPPQCRTENEKELLVIPHYVVTTFSQTIETDLKKDFLDFVKQSSEKPEYVEVGLACYRQPERMDPYEIRPPFFSLICDTDNVAVEIYRSTAEVALSFLSDIEQVLQLTPAMSQPEPRQKDEKPRLKRNIFIAHSFDDTGRSYAFQLTKFLSLLGFEVATGEGFSPERISSKVKRRLASQEIVITVLSEKDDMTWLIQEMAAAEVREKPIIILVEEGVTFKPGLLGDIEYIKFPKGAISECITPIMEGLREIGFQFVSPWQ